MHQGGVSGHGRVPPQTQFTGGWWCVVLKGWGGGVCHVAGGWDASNVVMIKFTASVTTPKGLYGIVI